VTVLIEFRSIPCDDERCPTVLGGPAEPNLCEDCREQFERLGIATSDEQLELASDEERVA
jgi:hypothetical protein